MLNPCAKNSASPGRRFGSIASAYSLRWVVSGVSTMIRSAPRARLLRRGHFEPRRLRALARPGSLGQPHPYVAARVAQAQRMRVALRAVAEDGNLAGLNEAEVGVAVVVHGGHVGNVLSE